MPSSAKPVKGNIIAPSANFTRPADTTAYASGDLVANNTTAGSVVAMSWSVTNTGDGAVNGMVRRVRLQTSSTSVTNSSFRLHLYSSAPVPVNGDNAAWSTPVAGYLGSVDITVDKAFSDGARGEGVPNTGAEVNLTDVTTIYGLLEARAAYTPTSAGVFTVVLETHIY